MHDTMERKAVSSSTIAEVGYDAATCVLEVAFVNGRIYRYFAVPPRVHAGLIVADSVGRYFNECIRNVYPHARV